jgi:hypothetical protein
MWPYGLIIQEWMIEHKRYKAPQRPWIAPPTQRACQHKGFQWFVKPFDKDVDKAPDDAAPFNSAADVGDPNDLNPLYQMCQSVWDTLHISQSLYDTMRTREDLYLQYHQGKGGGFSLCIGCANCSSRTAHYYPQNEVGHMGWNPEDAKGKQLKQLPVVQQAFRAFLSIILDDPSLATKHHCRHLHEDPPLPQPQLTWEEPQVAPTAGPPGPVAGEDWNVGRTFDNPGNGGGGGGGGL